MPHPAASSKPFVLPPARRKGLRGWLWNRLRPWAERVLAFGELNRLHALADALGPGRPFSDRVLDAMGITCRVARAELDGVPAAGSLVVVANHPMGGVEGIVLSALLQRVRPDVKFLANYLLRAVRGMREEFIAVDPFGGAGSAQRSSAGLRQALRWVKSGHCLVIFPAGEVSHLRWRTGSVIDPAWEPAMGRLIRRTGASVVPAFFDGGNSALFHLAGLIHPRLRTLLLPRELIRRKRRSITVRMGSVVPPAKLARFETPDELIDYLRVRTYILKTRVARPRPAPRPRPRLIRPVRREEPIEPARPTEAVEAELARLPADQLLLASGDYQVYFVRAAQAPNLLHEIGRQRELAFRGVGEGTGKALDLDEFDREYLHLAVWHEAHRELVGAYRLGPTDEILTRRGKAGLYTSTLFRYRTRLLRQIGPALEMGRSFVRESYQGEHMPLMLLWKGIARFCALHPRYKTLFGPVSISNEYQSLSRQLLTAFLRKNHSLPDLAQKVRPRTPPHFRTIREWSERATRLAVRDLAEVDELIGEIEKRMKSMPVLVRQYLKLNARMLAVNVDADFSDTLDALMLVDMTQVSQAVLMRYMGADDLRTFLSYHGIEMQTKRRRREVATV